MDLSAELLWDDQPAITEAYLKLDQKRDQLERLWGTRTLSCTLEVASILLDIDSYQKLAGDSVQNTKIKSKIRSLGFEESVHGINLGLNYPQKLILQDEDFGLLQGLVWELQIPLRKSA